MKKLIIFGLMVLACSFVFCPLAESKSEFFSIDSLKKETSWDSLLAKTNSMDESKVTDEDFLISTLIGYLSRFQLDNCKEDLFKMGIKSHSEDTTISFLEKVNRILEIFTASNLNITFDVQEEVNNSLENNLLLTIKTMRIR